MKIFALALLCIAVIVNSASAHVIYAPDNKILKVHLALLQAKPGKMSEMAAISSRTVAKFTPYESGSYALYGAIDNSNHDLMRILEIYEDESAYQVHRSSEGFKNFINERKPILESLNFIEIEPIILQQKSNGAGHDYIMNIFDVRSDKLDEFKNLMTQEFTRAVEQEPGVLALLAGSEKGGKSYRIYTFEIYENNESKQKYFDSSKYINYRKKVDSFMTASEKINNMPANVNLSSKGLHLDPSQADLSAFPLGEPNDAYAQYFDGKSYLAILSREQVFIANVTFEPACRNHWHIHHAKTGGGQILVVINGRGYYQEEGKEARELKPGDVVNIPANVKHWHGAAKDSWFQHLAIEVAGEETSNEWCEPVSPEEYSRLK